MNTETQTPRLIDANALKERMNSDFWSNTADLVDALEIIESAPTVETTDDVMARLPHGSDTEKWMLYAKGKTEVFYKGVYDLQEIGGDRIEVRGATPLEAVKKLEASLNPK